METINKISSFKKRRNLVYTTLFVVTSLMILARFYFYDTHFYINPQVVPDVLSDYSTADLRSYLQDSHHHKSSKYYSFLMFFLVDLLFPVLLFSAAMMTLGKHRRSKKLLMITASLAIIADVLENVSFLAMDVSIQTLEYFQGAKIYTYGLFFIVWFYQIYKHFLQGRFKYIYKAILASILSLLMAIIFAILMTSMEQGTSLVIEMLSSSGNYLMFFLLIIFSSLIVSHYPQFIYYFIFPSAKFEWRKKYRFGIFPVIYFNISERERDTLFEIKTKLESLKDKENVHANISDFLKMEVFNKNQQNKLSREKYINELSIFQSKKQSFDKYSYKNVIDDDNKVLKDTLQELEDLISQKESNKVFKYIRHYLGSFLFLTIIYVLLFTGFKVFLGKPSFFATEITILLGVFILAFQVYLYNMRNRIRIIVADSSSGELVDNERGDMAKSRVFFYLFIFFLIIQILLGIGRFVLMDGWSQFNVMLAILQFFLALISYVFFREFRSLFKYRFGLSKSFSTKSNSQKLLINDKKQHYRTFYKKTFISEISQRVPFLGNLSNNEYFILLSLAFNFILLLVILYFSFFKTTALNGANYLLAYIVLYYGLVIAVLKLIFYYERGNRTKSPITTKLSGFNKLNISSVFFSYTAMLFLGLIVVGFMSGTDLHLLKSIDNEYSDHQNINEFREAIPYSADFDEYSKKYKSFFTVSSFGGGLKANYYTMKLLDKIQIETNHEFLYSTLSLSGVSGGGLGLANYYLMNGYGIRKEKFDDKIDQIGDLSILSIDCSYLMLQDFWREVFSITKPKYTDRSYRAMKEYQNIILTNPEEFVKQSYRDVHIDILKDHHFFPNLIMNTTSTRLQYGISQSIEGVNMPGSIDLLNIQLNEDPLDIKSLSFYDAVSTINRFPIFSPAAEVSNKGHFVDGGYFENSGMLSTLSFLDRLSDGQWATHQKLKINDQERGVVMINFINSKAHWINHILKEVYHEEEMIYKSKESTELSSILNTIAGTEMLPNYFIQLLKTKSKDSSQLTFIPIYMPYTVEYEDIVSYLKGEPRKPERLIHYLDKENEMIRNLLKQDSIYGYDYDKWGLVEPALSRDLSIPDKIYQNVMINTHPDILGKIDSIKSLMWE